MSKVKNISVITSILMIAITVTAVVLAQGPTVNFTKMVSNTAPIVGQPFTVTLEFSNNYTAPLQVRVTDPNPAPAYLSIFTPTITGGAVYSPAIDAVVWEGSLNVGSLPQQVKFQMLATDIPTAAIESGYPVTNTAYLVDLSSTGSLPGSLPNQMASASILIKPQVQQIPINTATNPDGSLTLSTPVNIVVQDNQLQFELQLGTVISATNIPPGGVQLGYVSNHTTDPTGTDRPFAGRRFTLELLSQTPPYTPITPVSFNPPITFTAFYDPAQLAAVGISPETVIIQYKSASAVTWTDIPETDIVERGAGTTPQNSYVKFLVGHLTNFALVGPTKQYLPIIVK
ncbi:MAG: hypothetical protein HYR94_02730 [Chloroflexi bacterium]|nr:hypothetical protein [Chloroflexota bacterium]